MRTIAWKCAVQAACTSLDRAYPPGFDEALDRVRNGDGGGVDLLVDFLEADPIFYRSGYVKEQLIRRLKRAPLDPGQAKRLRGVVIGIVLTRDAREFRHYGRLAHRVDTPALRDELRIIAGGSDAGQRRRATWMLEALEQAERTAGGRMRR